MEFGCIGEKLSHSFSKIIHNELCDYKYELCEIPCVGLDRFMRSADFKAINVTIPYKEAVIPYLDEISDTARKIGAVNTIVNNNGRLCGYNTDFSGMSALILKNEINLKGKKVLILGGGGTSKTAAAVAESLAAKEIYRVSRRGSGGALTYEEAVSSHSDTQVIINTTPCGMYPNIGSAAIDINCFPNLESVVDAVYNPLSSELVISAREKGLKAAGGLYMLVAQAVFAAEKFTGKSIPSSETDRVYEKLLREKRNIVLIGMPGCGKTTIGSKVAEMTSKAFIDTDWEIAEKTGMKIPDIIEKHGETAFRAIESEVIKELSAKQSSVIATGGGAVLNRRNVELLRENGIIVFIDRPIEDIAVTSDRPLSSSRELLERRYKERYGLYKAAADVRIEAVKELEINIEAVKEVLYNENFGA